MNFELETTIEICGVELDVLVEFDAAYVDNGIGAYEYWGARGVHHDYGWEIEEVYGMTAMSSIPDAVRNVILPSDYKSRKKYRKAHKRLVRRIEKTLATADVSEYVDDDAMYEVCSLPEPDYDRDDD